MEAQFEKIKAGQKEAWNKASAGWKKWDETMMNFLKPITDEMIQMLDLNENDHMLDIATGTGEPGLTIATILKHGKVIATDLSENMLAVAKENASIRSIYNFETVCCDASELPFKDSSFDSISCRLGVMFFPDILKAFNEMKRVLKPGGQMVISAWNNAEKNTWINTSMSTMITLLQLTPPAPGAPGLFRCAQKSYLSSLLSQSGLNNIKETDVLGQLNFETFDSYWSFITEVACPLAFSKAEINLQQQIKQTIFEILQQKFPIGTLALESSAILICGNK
jgi:ubiquinone/menaquinone biosynthesis C-methylase UbiE